MTAPGHGTIQIVQLYLMPFMYLTVMVLGLPLNLFSLWIFSRRLAQGNRSSLFLHKLAMADISWLLALPFIIKFHLSGMEWSLGQLLCRLVRMLYHTYFYRYLAIIHPLRSTALLTHQRAITLCVTLWVVAIILSIPVALLNSTLKCQTGNKTVCTMYILPTWCFVWKCVLAVLPPVPFSCFVGRTFRRDMWVTITKLLKKQRVEPQTGRNLQTSETGWTG